MRAAAAGAVLVLIVAMLAGLVHADGELPRRGQLAVRLAPESGLVRVDAGNPGSAAEGRFSAVHLWPVLGVHRGAIHAGSQESGVPDGAPLAGMMVTALNPNTGELGARAVSTEPIRSYAASSTAFSFSFELPRWTNQLRLGRPTQE